MKKNIDPNLEVEKSNNKKLKSKLNELKFEFEVLTQQNEASQNFHGVHESTYKRTHLASLLNMPSVSTI
jgi:hypothetical protein